MSSNDVTTTNIDLLNEVYLFESTNGIRSKCYNSSPWNGDENNVKFKSDKVILHEDNLVITQP
jgi:hypothetical protein